MDDLSPPRRSQPRRVIPGEIAPGIGLFIILYVIGASHPVWHEVSRNNEDTWRETAHAITAGMADATLAGAGLAIFAIVGTKTVRLVPGRIFGPGSTRTGPLESSQPGRTVANRYRGPGSPRPLPDMVERWGQPADLSRGDCAKWTTATRPECLNFAHGQLGE